MTTSIFQIYPVAHWGKSPVMYILLCSFLNKKFRLYILNIVYKSYTVYYFISSGMTCDLWTAIRYLYPLPCTSSNHLWGVFWRIHTYQLSIPMVVRFIFRVSVCLFKISWASMTVVPSQVTHEAFFRNVEASCDCWSVWWYLFASVILAKSVCLRTFGSTYFNQKLVHVIFNWTWFVQLSLWKALIFFPLESVLCRIAALLVECNGSSMSSWYLCRLRIQH